MKIGLISLRLFIEQQVLYNPKVYIPDNQCQLLN